MIEKRQQHWDHHQSMMYVCPAGQNLGPFSSTFLNNGTRVPESHSRSTSVLYTRLARHAEKSVPHHLHSPPKQNEGGCRETGKGKLHGQVLITKFIEYSILAFLDFPDVETCINLSVNSPCPLKARARGKRMKSDCGKLEMDVQERS